MTDETPTQPDAAAGATGDATATAPTDEQQPALTVNGQYVKDLSFENPNAPASLMQAGQQMPNVDVAVDVNASRLQDKVYEVVLSVRAEGKKEQETYFIAEVHYAGVFTIGGEVPEDYLQPMILIEAPRLLFPFARAIVSDAVRDGGFPPLLVHPIDFVGLYQQRIAQAQQQPDATSAPGNGGSDATTGDAGASTGGSEEKFKFELD